MTGNSGCMPSFFLQILSRSSQFNPSALYKSTLSQWESSIGHQNHHNSSAKKHKTIATWESVLSAMLETKLDPQRRCHCVWRRRGWGHSRFPAACYLRVCDTCSPHDPACPWSIPASEAKQESNHPRWKNLIGAFHPTVTGVVDTDFLDTLPRRNLSRDTPSCFKYALSAAATCSNL